MQRNMLQCVGVYNLMHNVVTFVSIIQWSVTLLSSSIHSPLFPCFYFLKLVLEVLVSHDLEGDPVKWPMVSLKLCPSHCFGQFSHFYVENCCRSCFKSNSYNLIPHAILTFSELSLLVIHMTQKLSNKAVLSAATHFQLIFSLDSVRISSWNERKPRILLHC